MRVLVVTAVAAESEAVAAGVADAASARVAVDVIAGGAGPAAAAVSTTRSLLAAEAAGTPYGLVVSAGIGGGFLPRAPLGSLVVADEIIAADLGAEDADGGFLPVEELGFGRGTHRPPAALTARMATALGTPGRAAGEVPPPRTRVAPVLTVSTGTGTAQRAAALTARHPRAAAEGMEGFGVAEAAAAHAVPRAPNAHRGPVPAGQAPPASVPCIEIRAISNTVGPRDRSAWRIGPALASLRYAFSLLTPIFEEPSP